MPSASSRLFLPGAGASADFWSSVASLLNNGAPQFCFSWPGLGNEPPRPDVNGLSDLTRLVEGKLGRSSDLIAQSMGGLVAILVAIRNAARVRKVVLTAASVGVAAHSSEGSIGCLTIVAPIGGGNVWPRRYTIAELETIADAAAIKRCGRIAHEKLQRAVEAYQWPTTADSGGLFFRSNKERRDQLKRILKLQAQNAPAEKIDEELQEIDAVTSQLLGPNLLRGGQH